MSQRDLSRILPLRFITISFLIFSATWVFTISTLYGSDINLTGNQILLIENTTYTNKGNITLGDNAQLIIRNASFNFDQDYHEQYSIQLNGNSRLTIESSSTLTSPYRFLLPSNDNSIVSVSNSTTRAASGWGAIFQPNGNSTFTASASILDSVGDMYNYSALTKATITIQDCTMGAFSFHFPLTAIVTLNNVKKGFISNLQLLKTNTGLPYDLNISNTTIQNEINAWIKDGASATFTNCEFHQVAPNDQAIVNIVNSSVNAMVLEFSNLSKEITLDGLSPESAVSHILDLSAYGSFTLNLSNAKIDEWDVKTVNCSGSIFTIQNSHLGLLRTVGDSSTIRVINTISDQLWIWDSTGIIDFTNATIGNWADTRSYTSLANNFLLKGNVIFNKADIINTSLGNQWFDTIVRREFPLQIAFSNPASLTVQARDPDGNIVFSGSPDNSGNLTILLTFTNLNYNRNWNLRLLNGSTILINRNISIGSSTPLIISSAGFDFNGDGKTDILWRHAQSGMLYSWFIDGMSSIFQGSPGTVDLAWEIKGIGDFNGDGKADILWRHKSSGMLYIWLMDGTTISSMGSPGTVDDLSWQIVGLGDFNGDGKADILWRHNVTGQLYIWIMNETSISSQGSPGTVGDLNWQIKSVGDFNGDGNTDILWQHNASGMLYIWLMNGTSISSMGSPGIVGDLSWQIKTVGDFNGDGNTDILWQHNASGMLYIWLMNGTTISSMGSPGIVGDLSWQIKRVGDFNGDGKVDILWRHNLSGMLYEWLMDGTTISSMGSLGTVSDGNWQIVAP